VVKKIKDKSKKTKVKSKLYIMRWLGDVEKTILKSFNQGHRGARSNQLSSPPWRGKGWVLVWTK
jgi:hypothetical protein